jgi:hypothetical protein
MDPDINRIFPGSGPLPSQWPRHESPPVEPALPSSPAVPTPPSLPEGDKDVREGIADRLRDVAERIEALGAAVRGLADELGRGER